MLSLPASKGFEVGSGFGGTLLTGKEHNDPIRARKGKVRTTQNNSGGVQGGISNGETLHFRVAFKPVATVMHEQETVDENLKNTTLRGRGRHDPCVLPRAVPMVEAMTALVLADHALRHRAQNQWKYQKKCSHYTELNFKVNYLVLASIHSIIRSRAAVRGGVT